MRVSPGEKHIFGEPQRCGVLLPEGKPVAEQEFKAPGIAGIGHDGVPEKRPYDLKKFRQQFREQSFDWVFTSALRMGNELFVRSMAIATASGSVRPLPRIQPISSWKW